MSAFREGDWICPSCSNHNYASKHVCNRCSHPKPDDGTGAPPPPPGGHPAMAMNAGAGQRGMREGDWICGSCNNHNYASKTQCNRCGEPFSPQFLVDGMKIAQSRTPNVITPPPTPLRPTYQPMPMPGGHGAPAFGGGVYGGGAAAAPGPLPNGFREGDWMCPNCNNHNYSSKAVCNRCQAPKPQPQFQQQFQQFQQVPQHQQFQQVQYVPVQSVPGMGHPGMAPANGFRQGDWACQACGNQNFASRENCNRCGAPKHMPNGFRQGDWICPQCNNHNYASKSVCNRCGAEKSEMPMAPMPGGNARSSPYGGAPPPPMMGSPAKGKGKAPPREGDWNCGSCGNYNYASKVVCNRCSEPFKAEYLVEMDSSAGFAAGGRGRREGDWDCLACGNHNYASREACNKCGAPKPE